MSSALIPMLTYKDKTVGNAIELFESARHAPSEFWGFKDVGLDPVEMKELVDRMKDSGKIACLEGVRYSEDECLSTAELALECGFDYLLGTIYYESVHDLLHGEPIQYTPFCGNVRDHPSVLDGPVEEIIQHAKELEQSGVDGFDLLSYRYTGDSFDLTRRFMEAIDLPVIMAGGIGSYERLDEVRELDPFAYTIGTAFIEKNFVPDGTFADQIRDVVSYMMQD